MNDVKLKAREEILAKLNKTYGQGTVSVYGAGAKLDVEAVSTGSLAIDVALGVGGLARGRIVEIFGPEASGKTTLSLHCIAEAQSTGGLAAFIDAEHALDPAYAANIGVDMDDLVISQPSSGEQALQICETLIDSNAFDVIVVDSVAALVPQAEIDGDMGKSLPGLQARLMSQACRKLASKVAKSKSILIFINQIRNKIGVMFGSNETTSGGRALAFYSSQRMDIRRIAALKDGTDLVGNKTRVKIVKNKVAPPFKSCEIDIVYGKGIDKVSEVIDYAVHLNLVDKNGAHYQYAGERIGHGKAAARDWLEQNESVYAELCAQVRKHFGI